MIHLSAAFPSLGNACMNGLVSHSRDDRYILHKSAQRHLSKGDVANANLPNQAKFRVHDNSQQLVRFVRRSKTMGE